MFLSRCGRPLAAAAALANCIHGTALADEGGVSFWLPGQYGSFSAVPLEAGWSLPIFFYHTTVDLGASKDLEIGGQIAGDVSSDANLVFAAPTYALSNPVLGGQLALSLGAVVGSNDTSGRVDITGPEGGVVSIEREDAIVNFGDLYSSATIRWNDGVHNFMTYLSGDIPLGAYDTGRLANLGIGHAAIDGGVGYTYLDQAKGHEFSVVAGLTYNFENQHTDYQNGIDLHVDLAASQFISEQTHIGVVGYVYQQITDDTGSGNKVGDFNSRVIAIGPQIGYFFPIGERKAYANLKGYYEFAGENRATGWNAWATLSLPLGN